LAADPLNLFFKETAVWYLYYRHLRNWKIIYI
jgi:hypothetical protein